MGTTTWRLQDAKARFSSIVDAALEGAAQHVTRRGRRAVVVISEAEYERLQRNSLAAAPGFVAHLLAMPKGDVDAERARLAPRDVEFE